MLSVKMVKWLIDLVRGQLSVREFSGRFNAYLSDLWQTPELTPEKEALADLEHVLEEVADGLLNETEVYPVAQQLLDSAILALEQGPTIVIPYGQLETHEFVASACNTTLRSRIRDQGAIEDYHLSYQLA